MLKKIVIGAAVAALAASSASADIITLTWTGTVKEGKDALKAFTNSAKTNMAGKTFSAVYVFDTLLAGSSAPGSFWGGTRDSAGSSPLVSAQITIGTVTISVGGDYASGIASDNDGDSFLAGQAITRDDRYQTTLYNTVFSHDTTRGYGDPTFDDLNLALNLAENTNDFGSISSYFEIDEYNGPGFEHLFLQNTHVTLDRQIVVPPPRAVPEPASWTMMLGGFGLVGGALRSRRRVAVNFG